MHLFGKYFYMAINASPTVESKIPAMFFTDACVLKIVVVMRRSVPLAPRDAIASANPGLGDVP